MHRGIVQGISTATFCFLPHLEPEPIVNLTLVKNDSYEKGNDSMVVHVYVKEIHKEVSRVLFREQDFTLMFQTRYGDSCKADLLLSLLELDYTSSYSLLKDLKLVRLVNGERMASMSGLGALSVSPACILC